LPAYVACQGSLVTDELRRPLVNYVRLQSRAVHALIDLGNPKLEPIWDPQPGDVLFIPGAAWSQPDSAPMLRTAREIHGVRVAVLIHDIIPVRRPEWCDPQNVKVFRTWIESMLPLYDMIFSNSRATAEEVLDYARLRNST
jgi:hypothetical protein